MDNSPENLSAMYHVPSENNLTPEDWPIPWTLRVKLQLLDAVKWTATPLDINVSGPHADLMFAYYTDSVSSRQFVDELEPRLKAIGWMIASYQTTDGYLVVNLQKAI